MGGSPRWWLQQRQGECHGFERGATLARSGINGDSLDETNRKHDWPVIALELRTGFVPYLVGDPDLVEQVWMGS
jgi:hypothetical protein